MKKKLNNRIVNAVHHRWKYNSNECDFSDNFLEFQENIRNLIEELRSIPKI